MYNQSDPEVPFSSRHFGVLASVLTAALLCALAMSGWWAVQRVDAMVLAEESRVVAGGFVQERIRLVAAQKRSTTWDDAVLNLAANNGAWIAENLLARMGERPQGDRLYVSTPAGGVIGQDWQRTDRTGQLDPQDQAVLEPMLVDLRQRMAEAAIGLEDSTPAIARLGIVDLVRLSEGALALVSMQPVVGTSALTAQRPGTEFVHILVRPVDAGLLADLSARSGLSDLAAARPDSSHAALALRNAAGRQVGFLTWTPNRPARHLLRDRAPALLGFICLTLAGMVGLQAWLRRSARQLEASRAQTSFLAFHDPLTGLANRVLFRARLESAMAYEYLAAAKVLLIAIDLDRFKEVNDMLGHAAGDQLLEQVGKRLSQALSEGATLARLAGDEFAIVQPGIVSDGHARWLCENILQSLKAPFALVGGSVHVTASVGVALEPGDAVDPPEMLRRADIALYAAKAAGRNCFEIYTPEMDRIRRERRSLEVDLRHALISRTGLYLLYQPIFDAHTGEIEGAEALVRWLHPTRGHLAPDVFISIAEETGIIDALGLWVLDEASQFAVASGLPRVAVNVSPVQFLDGLFVDHVLQTLRHRNLAGARLELEITEGLLLKNSAQVQQALAALRQADVRIALDDFGTGYSSISYLRTYNVDSLKIDQSFTRLMVHDQATHTIVRSVVEMAHALGMSVTAEGVEEEPQRQSLQALGCNALQGYLLSRPLTGEQMAELLTRPRSAAQAG